MEPLEDRCLLAGTGFAEWAILGAYDDAPETQWFGDMDLQETENAGTSTYYSGHIDWDTPSHGKGPHGREMVAGVLDAGTGHLHLTGSPDGTVSGTQFSRIYDAQLRSDGIALVNGVWTDGSLTGSWHAVLCDGPRSDFDNSVGYDGSADVTENKPTGWHTTNTSDGVADWSDAGGDTGAYVRFSDNVNDKSVHALAPSRFLGNWLRPAADVPVMLSIDIRLDTDLTKLNHGPTFCIYGPGGIEYLKYSEPATNGDPINHQWETLIFPIVPGPDWIVAGDWNAVLNEVTKLEVWAEYITGAEQNGLDNIHLLLPKQPPGGISGHIWSDSNGNGAHEGSETGLAGRTVYLDANGNGSLDSGEVTQSTGADGSYLFNNVTAGLHTVRQVGVDGWTQTSPSGPRGRGMDQYATRAFGSSQFSDTDWSADQASGWPNVGTYGDNALAWAPWPENGSTETLTLGFDTPVLAIGATIRETLGNGFVTEVDALDQNGVFHPVWSGEDPSPPGSPVNFDVTWPPTSYQVIGLRITIDTDNDPSAWEEIDAVQLHGLLDPPEGSWADAAIQASANDASAPAALGKPDVPAYGDSPLAWKPSSMDGGAATLTLGYETPLFAYGAAIRQTCGNGFVTQVDAMDLAGNWHAVWSGTDPTQGGQPVDFNVTWPTPQYAVRGLRITVDTNHAPGEYEEIDAVRLFGTIDLSGGQNATSVIDFSSQRSSTDHSADQATGAFNVYAYGDKIAAWAPVAKTDTTEFLTLGFATPVFATGAMIRETCGNGFITGIDVLDVEGNYHNEWAEKTDLSVTGVPANFRVSWDETPFLVRGLRIDIDTSRNGTKWDEIDAVWLFGDLPADGCMVSVSPNEISTADFESLDITPPVVVSAIASRPTVADPLVGPAGFTVAVTYDKPMSSSSTPAIAFTPDVTSTLTLAAGSWSGQTYTAAYDMADAGVLLPHVGISVSGARDAAGLLEAPFSADNLFAVVTVNPTVTVASLTTGSRTPTLIGTVASADPSIPIAAVTVLVGGQSLAATVNGGVWSVPVENALPDGPYDVQATAIDPFGNRGIDATTGELTVDTVTPMVERISPSQGPSRGGASVTITGWNLGNALTVHFGAYPAASFTIDSDTQITAVSPAGSGAVDVTVATAGSTSATSSADRFVFLSLDADGNGQAIGLSDGILVLRYLFDFRGHSLVQGSLGAGATRTDPEQLVAFLETARDSMLDVDGNARIEPMADGLLLLRYLFDFRGAALVKGVLGQNATRTDPQQIVAFLDTFLPPGSSKGAAEPNTAQTSSSCSVQDKSSSSTWRSTCWRMPELPFRCVRKRPPV